MIVINSQLYEKRVLKDGYYDAHNYHKLKDFSKLQFPKKGTCGGCNQQKRLIIAFQTIIMCKECFKTY